MGGVPEPYDGVWYCQGLLLHVPSLQGLFLCYTLYVLPITALSPEGEGNSNKMCVTTVLVVYINYISEGWSHRYQWCLV